MLSADDFVAVISMDYSKAFDTVSHYPLLQKPVSRDIPDHIYNWLANNFQSRGHITRFLGLASEPKSLNSSVISVGLSIFCGRFF